MIREVLQTFSTEPDFSKIEALIGSEVNPDEIFDFGSFVICRSGATRNPVVISDEGQRKAVDKWIGKPILLKGHDYQSTTNQIGRIYDAWIEERDGETYTMGRGFAPRTESDKDIHTKIKYRQHIEMSCGFDPIKSVCSVCNSEINQEKRICGNGHSVGEDGCISIDLEFEPHHIAFVGDPAIPQAGLVAAHRITEAELTVMQRDAEDGRKYRESLIHAFAAEYRKSHFDASDDEINGLVRNMAADGIQKLTATIAERRTFADLPKGQQSAANRNEDEPEDGPIPSAKDLIAEKRNCKESI